MKIKIQQDDGRQKAQL